MAEARDRQRRGLARLDAVERLATNGKPAPEHICEAAEKADAAVCDFAFRAAQARHDAQLCRVNASLWNEVLFMHKLQTQAALASGMPSGELRS